MKENSREEDILNIEKYVELVIDKNYCDCNELNVICSGRHCDGSKNVAYSMQHILSDYKRVLKENEELKTANKKLKTLIPNTFTPSIVLKEEKYKTNEIKCLGNKKLWK